MRKKFNKKERYFNGIAVVHLDGAIMPKIPRRPSMGSITPKEIIDDLELARNDKYIKAVLLSINSPGGSPVASEEIADEVKYLREEKPVVGLFRDLGASGGYLVASACNELVAQKTSIVGSIGVLFGKNTYHELMRNLGVGHETFKAGKYKDLLSPHRDITDEERALVQKMINTSYDHFIDIVSRNRNLEEEAVREMATGWIFLGEEAKEKGLIDYIGNKQTAVERCEALGNFEHDKIVEKPDKSKGLLGRLMSPSTMSEVAYAHGQGIADTLTGKAEDRYILF